MSLTPNHVSRGSALSEYLAQTGASLRRSSAGSSEETFATALTRSLERLGIPSDRIRVAVEPPGKSPNSANAATRRFIVTLEAAPAAEEAPAGDIPPYDQKLGPRITPEMWTEEMLTEDVSEELLHNMTEPAAFLNARVAKIRQPTDARVVNGYDGSSTALNPSQMSTREQAEQVLERLRGLGIDAGEIAESNPGGGPFSVDWGGDDRRLYDIGGLSAGLILEKYARYPKEFADRMLLDEWSMMSGA